MITEFQDFDEFFLNYFELLNFQVIIQKVPGVPIDFKIKITRYIVAK